MIRKVVCLLFVVTDKIHHESTLRFVHERRLVCMDVTHPSVPFVSSHRPCPLVLQVVLKMKVCRCGCRRPRQIKNKKNAAKRVLEKVYRNE